MNEAQFVALEEWVQHAIEVGRAGTDVPIYTAKGIALSIYMDLERLK